MLQTSRSFLIAAFTAVLLTACSPADGEDAGSNGVEQSEAGFLKTVSFGEQNGSVIIGNPDADVELVEYASLTCGHCKSFHIDVLSRIKADYIATGKVRFVFQEFPTEPINVALAGFSLARCSGESGYLGFIDDFFGSQDEIFTSGRAGTIEQTLKDLGKRHGVEEAEFENCITNRDHRRAVSESVEYGRSQNVNSTPSLILNGKKLDSPASRTPDGLAALIDEALAEAANTDAEIDQ